MKRIKYTIRTVSTDGMDENGNPIEREILTNKSMPDTEENRAVALTEAYGEITPYDDGKPEPENEPTTDDVLNALLGVTSNE